MNTIKEKLIEYYRTSECNRDGELDTIVASKIAKTDKELDQLRELVFVGNHGGYIGRYRGFFPWGDFRDIDTEEQCMRAFQENTNRHKPKRPW